MKRLSIENRTKRERNAGGEDEISSPLLSLSVPTDVRLRIACELESLARCDCARSISRRDTILFSFTMVVER